MLGVGLVEGVDAPEVQSRLLDAGLVINATDPHTLRLLPPLVIGEAEADEALELLGKALG
jgi:acetylornithine/succinyldiaminopimelate/putrescine aminotransferase